MLQRKLVSGKLIAVLVYVAAFALVAHKAWHFWLGRQSRSWPSVMGTVIEARIVGRRSRAPAGAPGKGDEYFGVEVRYDYEVRGKKYIGTRLSFGDDDFPDYDSAIHALHGVAAGRAVQVYYDPLRPQRAVLRTGMGL